MEQQELEKKRERKKRKRRRRRGDGTVWKVLLTVFVTLCIAIGIFCRMLGPGGRALVEGWLLARYAFVEEDADLEKAADQALNAMVNGLGDRWSYYRDAESYRELKARRANNYVGVGVTVTTDREEGLYILSVAEGGPAEQAGIVPGDIITAVDGVSIAGEAREHGTGLVVGEAGTDVALTLLGEDGSTRTVTCTRAVLPNPSASGKMLEDQIGYVKLANFYTGAADSFRGEVDRLVEQGARGLVIDLRDDPGGYITELTAILDYLLPEGDVFREDPRWWSEAVTHSGPECIDLPFVTIVNEDTYSAAEIMAAELREFLGSPVVGERTSGKGYSQTTFSLQNGGGMGLSTATYYTGGGHSLIGEGIIPDVEVERGRGGDAQLQAALELLKN